MANKRAFFFIKATAVILLMTALLFPLSVTAANLFPIYDCIKPNVKFWQEIYSRYDTSQGVIHDKDDLALIYEVISLEKSSIAGAEKRNQQLIRQVKEKYRNILERLARREKPVSLEEKKVLALFGNATTATELKRASDSIRCQVGQKDRFRQGLIRSGAYLEEIKATFRGHGLPEDLAYLPHVESSFDYQAYSKSGAAGIWQFTRSTGKRFMSIGYDLDERLDPISATRAAAFFLKENHERLNSWPLAITAYNHGPAGMERAKQLRGDYVNIFLKYDGKSFKFASKNFYPEFLAAKEVATNYEKYFGRITLDKPVPRLEVKMPGYSSVHDLATHFGVSLEVIQRFNPAIRPPVLAGRAYVPKGYSLRLPASSDPRSAVRVRQLPSTLFRNREWPGHFYRVKPGDTAYRVARLHGVQLDDLLHANQLDKNGMIVVGQNLRIPALPGKKEKATNGKNPVKKSRPLTKSDKKMASHSASEAPQKRPVRAKVKPELALIEKTGPANEVSR